MKTTKPNFVFYVLIALSLLAPIFFMASVSPADAANQTLWDMQKDSGLEDVGAEAFGDSTPTDVRVLTAKIIKVFLGFLGTVFLFLVVWSGFKYMTAGGSEEKISEAIGQIRTGFIGLLIILVSYAIAVYVTDCFMDITTGSSTWMCK